ncbi:MAG: hypothetical protein WCG75_06065, partial [Armatimonadota bacterium]
PSFYTLRMTGKDFAISLLEESGYQFKMCLANISDDGFVSKPLGHVMSLREALEHQAEACIAVQKDAVGEKHQWGTYHFPEAPIADLIEIYDVERAKAVDIALDKFDEHSHYAKDYLIAHEFYHVGQMAAVRIALNDGFEAYSIYRF